MCETQHYFLATAPATAMTPSPLLEALVRDASNSVKEYTFVRQAPDLGGKRHLKFVMDSARSASTHPRSSHV
jgi:hypothetical protein